MTTTDQKSPKPDDVGDGIAEFASQMANAAAEKVADKSQETIRQQKGTGADHLGRIGQAVHGAAEEFGKELPQAAGYIHSAANALEGASTALRERSVEDLLSTFNSFARRQPAAAFAGSVLAGFALARFLKSSSAES